MRNWQDYATDSNTNSSHRPIPAQLTTKKSSPSTPRPSKAWLYFNIFLTLLCIVSLIYGIINTLIMRQGPAQIPGNLAITLIIPGVIVTYLCLILAGEIINNSFGIVIIGLFVSIALGVAIIVNATLAFVRYHRQRDPKPFATKNLIFALIPPIYIILILIVFFLNRP